MDQFTTTIGQPNLTSILFFIAFISITIGITYFAAKRTRTTAEFYTAGGGISGFQNGLALAGDYMFRPAPAARCGHTPAPRRNWWR